MSKTMVSTGIGRPAPASAPLVARRALAGGTTGGANAAGHAPDGGLTPEELQAATAAASASLAAELRQRCGARRRTDGRCRHERRSVEAIASRFDASGAAGVRWCGLRRKRKRQGPKLLRRADVAPERSTTDSRIHTHAHKQALTRYKRNADNASQI